MTRTEKNGVRVVMMACLWAKGGGPYHEEKLREAITRFEEGKGRIPVPKEEKNHVRRSEERETGSRVRG